MAQIDKLFTAIWHDTTTWPGSPLTGLSATATIRRKDTNAIVVDNLPMTEVGLWEYDYFYEWMLANVPYSYVLNPNTTSAYVVSGFVDPRSSYLDKPLSSIIGAFNINKSSQYDFGMEDRLNLKAIKEAITTPADLSEIKSHIDLAKTDIIDTIESIEIPESKLEEKEAKKAVKLLTTLDKKVSGYIDSEMSDKEELGAIAKQFSKLEMEDAMKEKEKEMEHKKKKEEEEKMEAEQDKKLLEEIKKEFDKRDEMEKEEKRKELKKELEETLKEAEEIKKELKTI